MIRPAFLAAALALLSLSGCDTDILSAERDKTTSSVGTVREIDSASRRFVVRADGQILTLRATDTLRKRHSPRAVIGWLLALVHKGARGDDLRECVGKRGEGEDPWRGGRSLPFSSAEEGLICRKWDCTTRPSPSFARRRES